MNQPHNLQPHSRQTRTHPELVGGLAGGITDGLDAAEALDRLCG